MVAVAIRRSMANGDGSSSGWLRPYHAVVPPPASFVELRAANRRGWVTPELAALGLDAFWAPLQPLPGAKGRGGVGRLELAGRQVVVRPYRRGGALAGVLGDRYAGPGRARDELQLLAALQRLGVPVVTPLAAVARRHGMFWRLRLCTEWWPAALPVPAFLAAEPRRRRECAAAVGGAVQRALAAGLQHPDLHVDNVLCRLVDGAVQVVLVDLDRARLCAALTARQRDDMLVRMARHLVRHHERLPARPSAAEIMRFLCAFWPARAERHRQWRRLGARLQRALRRRRLRWRRVSSA
jgi:3-deoxy-D-manno-octulosonic acid kinase